MVGTNLGKKHYHLRKKYHLDLENYIHKHHFKWFMDKFVYFIAIISPLFTIPQIIEIWVNKNTLGVSFITWASFLFFSLIWLIYGIINKEKAIIFANLLWIISFILILGGLLIHS